MPVIKSAQKRMRQEVVRRQRNRRVKNELRAATKDLLRSIESGDAKKSSELLVKVQKELARATKKNIIHKNTAARRLSRLNSRVKSLASTKNTKKSVAKTPAKKPAPAKKATSKKKA